MQEKISELQNEALEAAAEHIRQQRARNANSRLVAVCLTCLLVVAMICATVLGCTAIMSQQDTIREQQYALNMQYAGLSDLLSGAEIVTEEYTAESDGDGSISVAEDGNYTVGGDVNGEQGNSRPSRRRLTCQAKASF